MGYVIPPPSVLIRPAAPKMLAGLTLIEQAEWKANQPRKIPATTIER